MDLKKWIKFAALLIALSMLAPAAPVWAGFWDDIKKTVNTAKKSSKEGKYDVTEHDETDEYMRDEREKKKAAERDAKSKTKKSAPESSSKK